MQIFTRKVLFTLGAGASIFLAIAVNGALSANQQKAQPEKAEIQYPLVSVEHVTPVSEKARIFAYGEVRSRNQLALTSQVSGKVVYLSPKLLSGETFKQGEVLAEIEDVVFQQALANAEATLVEAKLTLAQEQLNNQLAISEKLRSGLATKQVSKLQLEVAQAKYALAQKNVEKAKYDLEQTKIIAPFDALVIERQVQLGSNVQFGSVIADLYDTHLFEVALPLSASQWQLLPKDKHSQQFEGMQILLTDESNSQQWRATFDRVEQHRNSQSRQRSLVVMVSEPMTLKTPLFPGTFVKASISGLELDGLWKIPASALIDDASVWQVTEGELLKSLAINVKFSHDDYVYVTPEYEMQSARIVKRPLASYLSNMKVEAQVESSIREDESTLARTKQSSKASDKEAL